MLKVLVCGGRDFRNKTVAFAALDQLHGNPGIDCIIHGGASGADYLAGRWAYYAAIPVLEFQAHWSQLGKAAGPIRNAQMLAEGRPDLVVAFPGGKGTADMTNRAKRAGIHVKVID